MVRVRATSAQRFFADGSALAHGGIGEPRRSLDAPPAQTPHIEARKVILFRGLPGGGELARYGTFEMGREIYYTNPEPRQSGFVIQKSPLLPHTHSAVSGTDLYISAGETFEIRVFDGSGRAVSIVRKEHTPFRIPASYRDSMWDATVTMMREAGEPWLAQMQPPPLPAAAPALDRLLVDTDRNIWVRESQPGSGLTPRWYIFDSTHTLRQSLRMSLDPVQIGSDFVLAVTYDADRVPHLVLHRIRKQ
jgi:hypothetical protein